MEIITLFIVLCLIILLGSVFIGSTETYQQSNMTAPTNLAYYQVNRPISEDSPLNSDRFKCNYKLNWQNDPNMFTNPEVTVNPFAKNNGEHCRTGSQCKSGQCNVFYCASNENEDT